MLGKPTHYRPGQKRVSACGIVTPEYAAFDARDCNCLRCQKTKAYKIYMQKPLIGYRCIDGGKCHHNCKSECFRELSCSPLSITGAKDWVELKQHLNTLKDSAKLR